MAFFLLNFKSLSIKFGQKFFKDFLRPLSDPNLSFSACPRWNFQLFQNNQHPTRHFAQTHSDGSCGKLRTCKNIILNPLERQIQKFPRLPLPLHSFLHSKNTWQNLRAWILHNFWLTKPSVPSELAPTPQSIPSPYWKFC